MVLAWPNSLRFWCYAACSRTDDLGLYILPRRLGEHEIQRDILERALGIMEAEFGHNSHKAGPGGLGFGIRVSGLQLGRVGLGV